MRRFSAPRPSGNGSPNGAARGMLCQRSEPLLRLCPRVWALKWGVGKLYVRVPRAPQWS